jgi:hypothetical protein
MRKEYREYWGDVVYEVWRSGGNPDRVDDDRVMDDYYDHAEPEDSAMRELRRMQTPPVERGEEE